MFDLSVDPQNDPHAPSFWWGVKFRQLHQKAVQSFHEIYGVLPVFFMQWDTSQVFLTEPSQAVIIDLESGQLRSHGRQKLWKVDYRHVKGLRPQDVAPQILDILTGERSLATWQPMIMGEMDVPEARVETLLARLAAAGIFSQHWPMREDKYTFRIFCAPELLHAMCYEEGTEFLHKAPG